jgi:hypothetical protein
MLVCATCGASFRKFEDWQIHSGNTGVGLEAFMRVTANKTMGGYCLVPGKLRFDVCHIRDGFFGASLPEVAKRLKIIAAKRTPG